MTGETGPAGPPATAPAATVRPLREGDVAACEALLRAAYAPVSSDRYLGTVADVRGRATSALVLVAEEDGVVRGCATLVLHGGPWREIAAGDEAELRMLAVDPAAQGRGVGTALVRALADLARAAGRSRLVCSSADAMSAAHQLYARLGFMRAPERDWSPAPGFVLRAFELTLR